jgi:hypothetical protein
MIIKMATWINGNAALPEFPAITERRMAGSGLFGGADKTDNWFHFPIATPVIIDDKRLSLTRAFVTYRMMFAQVLEVHIHSGQNRVATFAVNQTPTVPILRNEFRFAEDTLRDKFVESETMFTPTQPIEILLGLSVSMLVSFNSQVKVSTIHGPIVHKPNLGKIEFFSAGADWI